MSRPDRVKILIASGDAQFRSHLRAQLNNLGHLVVAETCSGREVLSLVKDLHPGLVIVDVELPDMSGLEVSRQIDVGRRIPVLLLGAFSDPVWVREACSISVIQAYLVKPVDGQDLEPAISLGVARFEQIERLRQLARR